MKRLANRVAVVTGGALGIGRAACLRLSEEGATVAVTDVREQEGLALADDLAARGRTAAFWRLDVTQESEVAAVFSEIVERFARIDVLVNNAGISGVSKPTHEVTETEWDALMAVNVKGVFFCTKHVIAPMRAVGGGSIVNLSSVYGIVGAGGVPPYHASKGAVRMMTKNDAVTYALDRIRVNSIHPGLIWTPMIAGIASSQAQADELRQGLGVLHPLGHVGEPDDVAWGIVYLASEEAKFVTGAELVIDGGYTAR